MCINHLFECCIFISSFTENVGKDIVFVSHNHLNFSGSNLFARNSGSSIRVCKHAH